MEFQARASGFGTQTNKVPPLFVSRPHGTAGKRPSSEEDNDDMVMKVVIICNSAVIEETVDMFLL